MTYLPRFLTVFAVCMALILFTSDFSFAQGNGQGNGQGLRNNTGLNNGQGFTTGQGHLNGNSAVDIPDDPEPEPEPDCMAWAIDLVDSWGYTDAIILDEETFSTVWRIFNPSDGTVWCYQYIYIAWYYEPLGVCRTGWISQGRVDCE